MPEQVRAFLAFLVDRRRIPADLPFRWQGHAYQLHVPTPDRVPDHGVLLVGDAAELADRASGEGIRPAVESGLLAADAILAAGGRCRLEDLLPYEAGLVARLGPQNAKHNEKEGKHKYFDFSCREGEFFLRGLKVYAVLPGKASVYGDCSYMIVENDANDPDEGLNWYVQALEVVLETIEYVLKTGEPERPAVVERLT